MKKKFKVYDYLEFTTVGYYDTIQEAKKAKAQFEYDTDGECDCAIMMWSERSQTYLCL